MDESEPVMSVFEWFADPANWSGPDGVPTRLVEHLYISGSAMLIALAVALPIGLVLGHLGKGSFLALNLGNIGRAVPTFGILVILASWAPIGIGDLAAILALAAFAIPPLLTNSYQGMRDVDPDLKSAAQGMGMSATQIVRHVSVPLALPTMSAGIRTATVQVVATASLAALVGGGGLGRYVVDGFATQNTTLILVGAILTAGISLAAELLLALGQRAVTPRGLRQQTHAAASDLIPTEG